jgi:hypothetical protein
VATLQSGNNPGPRIEAGDHLLDVAASLGAARTKPVAARLTTFTTQHTAYKKADEAVKTAEETVRKAQQDVAEKDVSQDAAMEGLASALAGEGFPRANPFKPLGFEAPATIKNKGYAAEAKEVQDLAGKVKAHKPALKASGKAADAALKAAKAVVAALQPVGKLIKARAAAISRRDALEQPWETAFAALKRGARAAEDEGAHGLFDALFGIDKPRPAKKAKAKKAEPPASPA